MVIILGSGHQQERMLGLIMAGKGGAGAGARCFGALGGSATPANLPAAIQRKPET